METKDLKNMARQAAELALQLAALPPDGLRHNLQPLEDLERLASRILSDASALRAATVRPVGESRGMWRAVQPMRP